MFKRRHPSLKFLGLIILFIGIVMFLYIIPLKIWFFIIASAFISVGFLLFKNS